MFTSIRALVISEAPIGDTDKLITVISAEGGKQTLKARGVKRRCSRIQAGCQLFCCSDMQIFTNRGIPTVNEAEPVTVFPGLREDPLRLALASYIADIAGKLADSDEPLDELMRLVLNCFYALSELECDHELVRTAFELRAAVIAGYEPMLDVCGNCGREPQIDFMFIPQLGELRCGKCAQEFSRSFACPAPLQLVLKHFATAPQSKLLNVRISPDLVILSTRITESYISDQLGMTFKSLDYYNSLRDYRY